MSLLDASSVEDGPSGHKKPEPLLEVNALAGGYSGIPVLRGVNLIVGIGESVGVLGHNGMGKSTLLKTLMGYLPPSAGTVRFEGTDLTGMRAHDRARLGIGYVPQGRGIFPGLSVAENLSFAFSDVSGYEDAESAMQASLRLFPRIQRLLDRQGGSLSGGEQQLLALARCLVADPVLILLDEPTEGIQPSIIEEIEETLRMIRTERELSILCVEQNLEFLDAISDRLVIFEKGTVSGEVSHENTMSDTLIEEFAGLGAARKTRDIAPQVIPQVIPQVLPQALASSPVTPATRQPHSLPSTPDVATSMNLSTSPSMSIRRPSLDQMRDVATGLNFTMPDRELMDFMAMMEDSFASYDRVHALPDNMPEVRYPRTPGTRPSVAENPLNAWYVKSEVRGAPSGPLRGKSIVLKDNICLAGVPMMNGASTLEGYVPDVDATLVTRILDAGGTILGKAHCEYFCLSGGSHTCAGGPVHNPWRMGYSASGSSSGCGALVGAGEVEMAIGGDQGGSIRMPASFCGCYGMKPTWGLVPYTGIMPIEPTVDHTGPMTTTVADNALLLEVIAGADGLDPRQFNPKVDRYTHALGKGASGLRIAIVKEGFARPESEAAVDAKVLAATELFRRMGATVDEVSIPMHLDGPAIWTPIALEGLTATMMHGNGFGTSWEGLYVTSLLDHHANWRARADELSPSLKVTMMVGEYFLKHHRGHYTAKAQNLVRVLRRAYDDVLERYDLLLMPTTPIKATPLPPPQAPISLIIQRAFELIGNTAPFDSTHHPAMAIPCGLVDGLPVSLMLVGRHFEETTIYRAAHAFEQAEDWRQL